MKYSLIKGNSCNKETASYGNTDYCKHSEITEKLKMMSYDEHNTSYSYSKERNGTHRKDNNIS